MLVGMRSNFLSPFLAACGLFALLGAAPSGPAASFIDAWSKVNSYTADIKVHETKGTDVQDRTYHYAFLKPHFAKIDITGGPGKGGGASWTGGDTVSGHQGGFLSGIHMNVGIHDGRAVDLRGYTIDQGSFDAMAKWIEAAATVTNGQDTWQGTVCDTVIAPFTDTNGATKRVLYLSTTTHLPVRRVTFAGDTIVMDEAFTNVNTSPNLKESDF
jgi:hypothetical protein